MNLKVVDGKVPYIMVAGADHVKGEMPLEEAQKMFSTGTKRASALFEGYPYCVNNRYFFACQPVAAPAKGKKTGKGKKR